MPFIVVLADESGELREAAAALLVYDGRFRVVASVETGAAAVEAAQRFRPDVAVIDTSLPGGGAPTIAAIRQVSPGTAVVVYSARLDASLREELVLAGAADLVTKGSAGFADRLAHVATRARRTPGEVPGG